MPIDRRDIETALEKKGFTRTSDGDHRYFTFYTEGGKKTSVWTKTSHGSAYKTLGDKLISAMAKQCGMTNAQFQQFVECTISHKGLETILVQNARIKVSE